MLDFIIVGGGLAGYTLANELLKAGQKIIVISNDTQPSSSKVAGGIFNPVTGKYLIKTWLADELFELVYTHYPELELRLNARFFYPVGLKRPFSNEQNRTHFIRQVEKNDLEEWLEIFSPNDEYKYGGLYTAKAGWVDIETLIAAFDHFFSGLKLKMNEAFDFQEFTTGDCVSYKGVLARKIIFAEGFYVKDNPFFSYLPMNPVKGEILELEVENLKEKCVVNKDKWFIPISDSKVKLGATYEWDDLDFMPTNSAKNQILAAVAKMPFDLKAVLQHRAGVRPATIDRRPFLGHHPRHENMLIFNGLGTKGVTLAPFFAKHFVDHLLHKKHLGYDANIERFNSLYS
jgi:glycine/D-amino acid oxidase-like deaminating enzyme